MVATAPPAARPGNTPRTDGGPVAATPSTRRLARELGVELQAVRGTGPGGRITDHDVRASAGKPSGAPAGAPGVAPRAVAPAGPAKPLARVGLEPPTLPKFEQWGPVE